MAMTVELWLAQRVECALRHANSMFLSLMSAGLILSVSGILGVKLLRFWPILEYR